ncbi:hypothetical protein WN943_007583 [Citrus x changshan-huyou]
MASGDNDLMKRKAEQRGNDIRVRVPNLQVHPNPELDPDTSELIKLNLDSRFNLLRYGLNPDRIFRVEDSSPAKFGIMEESGLSIVATLTGWGLFARFTDFTISGKSRDKRSCHGQQTLLATFDFIDPFWVYKLVIRQIL